MVPRRHTGRATTIRGSRMGIVAGVDFGTLSVRVTLVDTGKGPLATGSASYPLHRRREDPDFATQAHADHMDALARAMQAALEAGGIEGREVRSIAVDTTGSTVVMI